MTFHLYDTSPNLSVEPVGEAIAKPNLIPYRFLNPEVMESAPVVEEKEEPVKDEEVVVKCIELDKNDPYVMESLTVYIYNNGVQKRDDYCSDDAKKVIQYTCVKRDDKFLVKEIPALCTKSCFKGMCRGGTSFFG